MTNYLREFVIGASWPVFIFFFLGVLNSKNINYTYGQYTLIAPPFLGLMNVFSKYLQNTYQLSRRGRYLLIGVLSPLIVSSIAFLLQTYNYTPQEWISYALRLIVFHFLIFNLIIYNLDLYI